MSLTLSQIIPWGRSLAEYRLMFRLSAADLSAPILDCGGGPASFAGEARAAGHQVVAVDPIYQFSGDAIRARFEATAPSVLAQVRATPDAWSWTFHRNPDHLLANRRQVLEQFMADYEPGRRAGRYVVGGLPDLPFARGMFGLAVCSHLLFLYSDLLSAEFHCRSIRELCRAARELRIFPLLTLGREVSPHLELVRSAIGKEGWTSEIVKVDYELQRGGNEMLRVFRND